MGLPPHPEESKGLPFAAIAASVNLLLPDADVSLLIENIKAAAAVSGFTVNLVVIDTLSRAMAGGNENAPDDMGALIISMDRIRRETGACVLFVHHCGKDEAKGMRGHTSLLGAIDTEIEVSVDETTGDRAASVEKQRDLPKGQKFGFRLDKVTLGQNEHGEDVTTCLVAEAEGVPIARATRPVRPTAHDAALAELTRAIMDNGKIPPPSENIPPNVEAVTSEMWRTYCYGLHKPEATPEAKRQAFNRATKLLTDGCRVQTGDGWLWIVAK